MLLKGSRRGLLGSIQETGGDKVSVISRRGFRKLFKSFSSIANYFISTSIELLVSIESSLFQRGTICPWSGTMRHNNSHQGYFKRFAVNFRAEIIDNNYIEGSLTVLYIHSASINISLNVSRYIHLTICYSWYTSNWNRAVLHSLLLYKAYFFLSTESILLELVYTPVRTHARTDHTVSLAWKL